MVIAEKNQKNFDLETTHSRPLTKRSSVRRAIAQTSLDRSQKPKPNPSDPKRSTTGLSATIC
ncbi:MAG: hypothetical protein DWI26_04350 [Planctomycetota bacterium]|nr:MAG: hypothetical protein DWI26_04350 [Planctomycetota bacterium]